MDEIGRGTSTYDGLSLAWACATHIGAQRARLHAVRDALFRADVARDGELDGCANVHLDATEHGDKLIFLHTVKEGPANQSYGLQVAALAGVPPKVISAARTLSATNSSDARLATHAARPQQELLLELPPEAEPHAAVDALQRIDPDSLTPREALEALYELKKLTK